MKILILSAYNAVSHASLNSGLIKHLPDIEFTLLTLPPRYFAWRSRGNSLSFALENRDVLLQGYDLIFATSVTDMTALRGLVPEIAGIPYICYVHENQFEYPASRSSHQNIEAVMVSIYNAVAADRVVFNTAYNMQSFLDGAAKFLKKVPDHVPAGVAELIRGKSQVLSVPVEKAAVQNTHKGKPVILWNHRWEYDKGPDGFLYALRELKRRRADFGLNVVGQVFRDVPESFRLIEQEFSENIIRFGYAASREEYQKAVSESSVVISTSLHDFQGLSVIEAADTGCIPVLPDRLAYPFIFSPEYLYASSGDPQQEAVNCADLIMRAHELPMCDMSAYHWENLKGEYRKLFEK